MSKFFTLPVTNDILCLDGLQSIKLFLEEDTLNTSYMEFVYNRDTVIVMFENDDLMLDYHLSLINWLKVKTIESYSYYQKNKEIIRRQEGE